MEIEFDEDFLRQAAEPAQAEIIKSLVKKEDQAGFVCWDANPPSNVAYWRHKYTLFHRPTVNGGIADG